MGRPQPQMTRISLQRMYLIEDQLPLTAGIPINLHTSADAPAINTVVT